MSWKDYAGPIVDEHDRLGFDGRFGPGLPSKSDGQLLFVLQALDALAEHSDWVDIGVRKAHRDRAEKICAEVAEAVGALPDGGLSLSQADLWTRTAT